MLSFTSSRCSFAVVFSSTLAVIFILADLCCYGVLSSPPCLASNCSLTKPSVKLMMQDHMGYYVHHYSAEIFEEKTRISQLPFVTPNLITFLHLCVGCVAGYMVSSEKLLWRRVGIFLFQVRCFLDVLDGAVYRAQHNAHVLVNGWGTMGYYVDAAADSISGIFLCFGLYILLHRSAPRQGDTVLRSSEKSSRSAGEPFSMDMPVSRRSINATLALVLLQGFLRSFFWDRYQFLYYRVLQRKLTKASEVVSLLKCVLSSSSTRLGRFIQ